MSKYVVATWLESIQVVYPSEEFNFVGTAVEGVIVRSESNTLNIPNIKIVATGIPVLNLNLNTSTYPRKSVRILEWKYSNEYYIRASKTELDNAGIIIKEGEVITVIPWGETGAIYYIKNVIEDGDNVYIYLFPSPPAYIAQACDRFRLRHWFSNPAYCLYDFLTSKRYGLGNVIDPSQIDTDSFIEVAKYCNKVVYCPPLDKWHLRFECNYVVDQKSKSSDVIKNICASFMGFLYWMNGKIYLGCEKYEVPVATFDENDIREFSVSTFEEFQKANVLRISFLDVDENYERATIELRNKGPLRQGENIRISEMDLKSITKKEHAMLIGTTLLRSMEYVRWKASFKVPLAKFQDILPGQVINISHPSFGNGVEKSFRVVSISHEEGDILSIEAIEYSPDIYLREDIPNWEDFYNIDYVYESSFSISDMYEPPDFTFKILGLGISEEGMIVPQVQFKWRSQTAGWRYVLKVGSVQYSTNRTSITIGLNPGRYLVTLIPYLGDEPIFSQSRCYTHEVIVPTVEELLDVYSDFELELEILDISIDEYDVLEFRIRFPQIVWGTLENTRIVTVLDESLDIIDSSYYSVSIDRAYWLVRLLPNTDDRVRGHGIRYLKLPFKLKEVSVVSNDGKAMFQNTVKDDIHYLLIQWKFSFIENTVMKFTYNPAQYDNAYLDIIHHNPSLATSYSLTPYLVTCSLVLKPHQSETEERGIFPNPSIQFDSITWNTSRWGLPHSESYMITFDNVSLPNTITFKPNGEFDYAKRNDYMIDMTLLNDDVTLVRIPAGSYSDWELGYSSELETNSISFKLTCSLASNMIQFFDSIIAWFTLDTELVHSSLIEVNGSFDYSSYVNDSVMYLIRAHFESNNIVSIDYSNKRIYTYDRNWNITNALIRFMVYEL
ncbi:MAG: phage tail protein [Candidatus Helarchaeota archaeon]